MAYFPPPNSTPRLIDLPQSPPQSPPERPYRTRRVSPFQLFPYGNPNLRVPYPPVKGGSNLRLLGCEEFSAGLRFPWESRDYYTWPPGYDNSKWSEVTWYGFCGSPDGGNCGCSPNAPPENTKAVCKPKRLMQNNVRLLTCMNICHCGNRAYRERVSARREVRYGDLLGLPESPPSSNFGSGSSDVSGSSYIDGSNLKV
ncbi:MAG: hypothetical protein M1825_005513 [Sarcosagium campestre]|nr:MAG: hypothetical protein M1825_005513 [Sarcosagium campestre]